MPTLHQLSNTIFRHIPGFSRHPFFRFSPFHSCLFLSSTFCHYPKFEFKELNFMTLMSVIFRKFRLMKICHYSHKFKKTHKTHKYHKIIKNVKKAKI